MVVCDWELGEARKRDAIDRARVRARILQKREVCMQVLREM
jgi:hypothetical protein